MLDRKNVPNIPRLPVPDSIFASANALTSRWVSVGPKKDVRGCMVNWQVLEPNERRLLDDGDLLPRWGYFWLTLAEHLVQISEERGLGGVLIIPREPARKTELLDLTVRDVAGALASDGWWHEAGVILTWGIDGKLLNKPKFPLPCLGVVVPMADGLSAVSITSSEAGHAIPEWFEGRP